MQSLPNSVESQRADERGLKLEGQDPIRVRQEAFGLQAEQLSGPTERVSSLDGWLVPASGSKGGQATAAELREKVFIIRLAFSQAGMCGVSTSRTR